MEDYSFSHASIVSSCQSLSYASGHWINTLLSQTSCCVSHRVLLFPTARVRTGAIQRDLMHRDRLGPLQHHCGRWLWLLLTIIYGPFWLKTGELEIESWVHSWGTTLRYKAETTAAVRRWTPAKLCRPSGHPDEAGSHFTLFFFFVFRCLFILAWFESTLSRELDLENMCSLFICHCSFMPEQA